MKYEQAFVDAVRATGGNNETRTLIVQGPGTDIDKTIQYFSSMPTDVVANRLMVEVHYYNPPQFSGVWENGTPFYFWGAANHIASGFYKSYNATWGEESDLSSQFNKMKNKFADKGIPVLLGEFGANWRSISNSAAQKKHDASIKLFNKLVVQNAINCGMVPMVWDINVANQNGTNGVMTVINRDNCSVFCTPALEGIMEGASSGKWTIATGIDAIKSETVNLPVKAYNLQGQLVTPNTKGIVIINGKKYFNR